MLAAHTAACRLTGLSMIHILWEKPLSRIGLPGLMDATARTWIFGEAPEALTKTFGGFLAEFMEVPRFGARPILELLIAEEYTIFTPEAV